MLRHHKLGTLVQRTDGKSEKEAKVPGNLSGMLLFMNRRQFSSAEEPAFAPETTVPVMTPEAAVATEAEEGQPEVEADDHMS